MNNKEIHKSLKILRQKLGINQTEMAVKLGVSQSYYSEIEKGRKNKTDKGYKWLSTKIQQTFSLPSNWHIADVNTVEIPQNTNWNYCPHCGKSLQ